MRIGIDIDRTIADIQRQFALGKDQIAAVDIHIGVVVGNGEEVVISDRGFSGVDIQQLCQTDSHRREQTQENQQRDEHLEEDLAL